MFGYDKHERAKGTGFYSTDRIRKFCDEAIESIKKARIKRWEQEVEDYIERKRKDKEKWYHFLVSIPSEEQAINHLKNDNSWFSTYAYCKVAWSEDEEKIEKLINLCDTCESRYINLNMTMASLLKKWGLKEADKEIDGVD